MRICFLVNRLETEIHTYASTLLSYAAHKRGNQVFVGAVSDFSYLPDGSVALKVVEPPKKNFQNTATYLASIQDKKNRKKLITTADMDVLWLRYNPAEEVDERQWAQMAGIVFGQMAARNEVIVLNHPDTLAYAISKVYLQQFPSDIWPATIITRNADAIQHFYEEHGQQIILKPLMGYGGSDVFLIKKDAANLNQIVEAISRKGFIIAQEYVPAATSGDTRLIMVNGKLLEVEGRYAAITRMNKKDDVRHNISAGGKAVLAKVTDEMLELAAQVGPKLLRDGIFYAGVDIIGNKVIEINVISAGNLYSASRLQERNFAGAVIEAVERKVFYKENYGHKLSNRQIATMD